MNNKKTGVKTLFSSKGTASKLMVLSLALFILAVAHGKCLGAKPDDKDVVAKWGTKTTKSITKQDLEMRLSNLPPEAKEQFQTNEQKKVLLETLVIMQVTAAEARSQKLDKKANVAMLIEDMTNSFLYQEYLRQKIDSAKKLSDSDFEAYYKAHQVEYLTPKQIKARHIFLELKPDAKPEEVAAATAKAEGIYKEVMDGGDFAKLAEKYSEDPGSKAQGGDLGFFSADQMVPEFSKVAFALKKDEVSKPIKTEYGLHIIKAEDSKPEKQMDLKEALPAIKTKLETENRRELAKKEMDRLKKKYNVQIQDLK